RWSLHLTRRPRRGEVRCWRAEHRDLHIAVQDATKDKPALLAREQRTLRCAASENRAASYLEKKFSGGESRVVKLNGATNGRTVSSAPKQRRRRLVMSFELVRLDRASSEPLYQQLYRQIREELESGSFDSSASRVPSSRALAASLGISRPTVNQAFSKLLAEGYLQTRKRSGLFV